MSDELEYARAVAPPLNFGAVMMQWPAVSAIGFTALSWLPLRVFASFHAAGLAGFPEVVVGGSLGLASLGCMAIGLVFAIVALLGSGWGGLLAVTFFIWNLFWLWVRVVFMKAA